MTKSDSTQHRTDKEIQEAIEPAQETLKEALAENDTPKKAEAVVEKLVDEHGQRPAVEVAEEIAPEVEGESPLTQAEVAAEVITEAAEEKTDKVERSAKVLTATAAEAAALEGPAYEALTDQVQAVPTADQDKALVRQRRYLWDALKKQPGVDFLQIYDTELFILINNHTPRTATIDAFFSHLSDLFSGGWAWLVSVALIWPFRPAWAARTLRLIAPPIWIATAVVEGPVKRYFRRRRPFIDIVRAIVVGKKPGNWSFPSGHSAAAFAGARMLSRCLPRWGPLWYSIAGLVGFSRIYLGAHYPGDVVSGSLCGVALAELSRWVIKKMMKH
jgi:undecaprenyl-diphosphatase